MRAVHKSISLRRIPYLAHSTCTASIADIASSPSGHKICRTSLTTLVMFRTPNLTLLRSLPALFTLLPILPTGVLFLYPVAGQCKSTSAYADVHRNHPIPMNSFVSSATPNYFDSNLTTVKVKDIPGLGKYTVSRWVYAWIISYADRCFFRV